VGRTTPAKVGVAPGSARWITGFRWERRAATVDHVSERGNEAGAAAAVAPTGMIASAGAAAGPIPRSTTRPFPRTTRAERRTLTLPAALVAAGVAVAGWAVVVLHVAGALRAPAVDPLVHTVSDYVLLPAGHLVLGIAAAALALGATVLTVAAGRAGGSRAAVALLASWAAAMAVAGIVPTNVPGTPADVAAAVHRYAGAWIFAVLPLAVVLLAHGPAIRVAARRRVVGLALLTAALSGAFLLAHLPIVVAGSPAFPLLGGVERVLYGAVTALLITTALALREPATAETPATPAIPATPATSGTPPTAATSRTPAIPAPSATPAIPATSGTPPTPATSATPSSPATSGTPPTAATSGTPAIPAPSATPATPATPATSTIPAIPASAPGTTR
jgi:hypothetical protein